MLASPVHLYLYQLFTHCLPTIICVMLMSIVLFFYFIFTEFIWVFFSVHVLLSCFCCWVLMWRLPYHLHVLPKSKS